MNLRKRTIAAYASPAISIAALSLPLGVYLPPFYTNEMGLGLSVVGSIFMITRFWDIFTDPILGILSDKIETRLGRRRHWIILSAPILMLCVYKIFMPQGTVTGMYLLFWMILLYVGWTLLTISHMSWGAELSSDYNERSRIQGWREFANIFGSLAVLILPTIIEQTSDGDSAMKVAAMGWFTIVLLPISVAAAVWMVPEHPLPKQVQIGWRRATSIVLKNKLLIRLLAADLLNGMALGIISSMYIFFASHVMGLSQWVSLMLLIYIIACFLSVPAWIRLSYRFEKHRTFVIARVYFSIILLLVFWIQPGNFWLYVLANVLLGFGNAAGAFLMRSMMADIVDRDNLESGTQRTGLYYSLMTMTSKIGSAVAVGISYPMLDWIGFVPNGTNTPETIEALKNIFIFIPIPIMLLAALIVWNFPLDSDRQKHIRRLIEERDSQVIVE